MQTTMSRVANTATWYLKMSDSKTDDVYAQDYEEEVMLEYGLDLDTTSSEELEGKIVAFLEELELDFDTQAILLKRK